MSGASNRSKISTPEKIEIPKLRKNRKHELRWGVEYFNALKEIVFTVEPKSYVPAVIPKELRGNDGEDESLNACKQCHDS